MSEQRQYGFCPKCGAVMYGDVCSGCGYKKRIKSGAEQNMLQADQSYRERIMRRNGQVARMVLLFMGAAGILLAVLLTYNVVRGIVFRNLEQRAGTEEWAEAPAFGEDTERETDHLFDGSLVTEDVYVQGEPLHGKGGLYGGRPALLEAYSDYKPDPGDEFYRWLADALSYDLNYQVNWSSLDVASHAYTFPQVEMEDGELAERINSRIQEMLTSEDMVDLGENGAPAGTFYVTYMSEDILSIVLELGIYYPPVESAGVEYGFQHDILRAVNFDMQTGEEIPPEEIMPVSLGLCARFWDLCAYEHPYADVLETFESVENLAERFMDDALRIVFYTPVGVEMGLNYENGWITATLNREHSKPFYRYFLGEPDYEPEPDYKPNPKDDFYKRLVNAIPAELQEQVEFTSRCHEDETGRYYYYYPQLTGENIPNLDNVNEQIRKTACPVRDKAYIGASDGVETVSYVTYMDERLISIVVCVYTYYFNEEGIWEDLDRMSCITFDLASGREIPKDEIIRLDLDFAQSFQKLLEEQEIKNPDNYYYTSDISSEELLKTYLVNKELNLVFYTPVGIEAGFCNMDCYTVTIKENET